jgi:ethanolamine utilization microcompartment shell protein EutL
MAADEANEVGYVDVLLARAEAAGQGKPAPSASGNAYNVVFGP